MAQINVDMDFDHVQTLANKCESTCLKLIDKYNKELDEIIIKKLQPNWKSTRANKVYKKIKGHINNNYNFVVNTRKTNDEVIRVCKLSSND